MPTETPVRRLDPRPQRALRLAFGTAACLAASFGLALPIPFLPPVLTLFLLAMRNQPLSLRAGLALAALAALTTGGGLLLIPLLRYYPASGVLLVALCLFLCFRQALRGGNPLVTTFLTIGLTLVSAAGATAFALALTVIEALVKGLLLTSLCFALGHWLFPEPAELAAPPSRPLPSADEAAWIALRATLVVIPAFLLALIDPASYMPLVMKAVSLGQQVCATRARDAGRELLGSTLLGGLLAVCFWSALSLFPHLWMFFLWTLLFVLLLARRFHRLNDTRQTPGFWLNSAVTLIILLGQSVQDSAAGKDVYTAFAVRMGLFVAVTLYACAAVYLIDLRRLRRPISAI
ncbi:DUF2955 domain-containing protein [Azotobacter beijerinckii]|uniref:DUF2955 domain-containing protein n=1 Tax=Azotobacter beijerinckii TaxID=170623 RepID=A0A1I4CKS6_9GAMM|nr:DUF2955 domain-containing protein [Azotobacter beijerinckii]SFB37813.1 Protein of unknown function [Azotobacter beijerinckii]SFK80676.1 Protein of unknown function [Azotobacter beijerinckii]